MRRVLSGIAAVVCIGSVASAQERNAHTLVAKANQAFADADFAAALETYQAAEVILPESPELAYNQGVAWHMLRDYTQARDAFNRSLLTQDIGLEARIKFNLGNVAYASALEINSDPPAAINLLKSAIGHYRDAVELDPEDQDARTNVELAQRLIQDLLEKLKQQRKGQQQQQDDQQGREDDQEQPQQGDQQGDQQGGPQEDDPEHQQQSRLEADDRMTPQEVERLLQAVRDRERQRQDELTRRRDARRMPVVKDW